MFVGLTCADDGNLQFCAVTSKRHTPEKKKENIFEGSIEEKMKIEDQTLDENSSRNVRRVLRELEE